MKTNTTTDHSLQKLRLVAVVFALLWVGLAARAGWVQLYEGQRLAGLAERQHLAAEFEKGRRGSLLDREGRVLAKSLSFSSVYARPVEMVDREATVARLAEVLDVSRRTLRARLDTTRNFVWMARQVDDAAAKRIRDAAMPGVYITEEYGRTYPNKHLAGQLVGFTGVDGRGLEGLERGLDQRLAGGKAKFVVLRDASGRRLYLNDDGEEIEIDGEDVRLTIDLHLQDLAENELARAVQRQDAANGTTLVVDTRTGGVLAWAVYPFFNPNTFRSKSPAAWRNRVSLDVHEPGSTLKPFVVAAAMEQGVVRATDRVDCEGGEWEVRGRRVRDTHEYDWLSVNEVVRYSSNIGSAKIGLALGAPAYYDSLRALGFGRTGADVVRGGGLPVPESAGILHPAGRWGDVELANISFGQGVGVTAVQLARAYLCLANGGRMKKLTLLQEEAAQGGADGERVYDEAVASAVMRMLVEVVQADGTGKSMRIPGVVLAGKTGTAQKPSADGGYGKEYLSSFVGFVPGDAPEYLIVTLVDAPKRQYYGGQVAGPVVRGVALGALAAQGRLPDTAVHAVAANAKAHQVSEVVGDAVTTHGPAHTAVQTVNAVSGTVCATQEADFSTGAPDLRGMDLRGAMRMLLNAGVTPTLSGSGVVVARQAPLPGVAYDPASGRPFTLFLADTAGGGAS